MIIHDSIIVERFKIVLDCMVMVTSLKIRRMHALHLGNLTNILPCASVTSDCVSFTTKILFGHP
jgi:hypothetical protein